MFEKSVRRGFDPGGHHLIGRPPVRQVVLKTAIIRRVVRRRDDDAVRQPRGAAAVVLEDRVRHRRSWRVFVVSRDHDLDVVGGQHLERAGISGYGERVRVDAEKQGTIDATSFSIPANGLTDGENMPFVEAMFEGGTAMSRGAEHDPLRRYRRIRHTGIVGRYESRHIDQHRGRGRLACQRAYTHGPILGATVSAYCALFQWSRWKHASGLDALDLQPDKWAGAVYQTARVGEGWARSKTFTHSR